MPILVEPRQTAGSSDPEGAVRCGCQRHDYIVGQAVIGVGFGVRLPVAVLVEPRQAAGSSGPEGAVRSERQCLDCIVRQAAVGARLAVGLPVPVLVKPRETAQCSGPQRAVRSDRQVLDAIVRQLAVLRIEDRPDRDRGRKRGVGIRTNTNGRREGKLPDERKRVANSLSHTRFLFSRFCTAMTMLRRHGGAQDAMGMSGSLGSHSVQHSPRRCTILTVSTRQRRVPLIKTATAVFSAVWSADTPIPKSPILGGGIPSRFQSRY